MKPVRTWILVADGARARIFLNDGPGHGLKPLSQIDHELKPSREIDADRPGRTFDSAGLGRHAKEPPTDPKRHSKQAFATQLADRLKAALNGHEFDRLIVVAAPVTLGDLRKELDKTVLNKLHGEIAKDLTHANEDEIAKHLESVLAV